MIVGRISLGDRETFTPGSRGSIKPNPLQWNPQTIRALEVESIRSFVERHKEYLAFGKVLDFGAGKPGTCRTPQPYRDLVAGEYHPWDLGDAPLQVDAYSAVLCTQVLQYCEDPKTTVLWLRRWLKPGGVLVLTGPTNWEEVEESDLCRFTCSGIRKLLKSAGFHVVTCESRAEIDLGGAKFSLGYGVVARRQ